LDSDFNFVKSIGSEYNLYSLESIEVDNNKNIFVLDKWNNKVSKIDSDLNLVNEFGGLSLPNDISLDDYGNLYIADSGNNRILKLDNNLNFLESIGTNYPTYLTVDSYKNIYSSYVNKINIFDEDLQFSNEIEVYSTASHSITSVGAEGEFLFLTSKWMQKSGGILKRYLKIYKEDKLLELNILEGADLLSPKEHNFPLGKFEFYGGDIYLADKGNDRLLIIKIEK